MLDLLASNSLFLFGAVAAFSLLVGSFLNVVIWRFPRRLQYSWRQDCQALLAETQRTEKNSVSSATVTEPPGLVWPASHCPKCQTAVKPWDNIPVISYLLLAGKCRQCREPIGLRYPIVELLTAIVSVAVVWQLGATPHAGLIIVLTWFLVAMTGIDIDHKLLPDQLTLPLLWLGLLASTQGWGVVSPTEAVIGAAVGYLLLWSFYHLFRIVTGKHGMGYGDFKLLAALGAFTGWELLPAIILVASITGAVIGVIWLTINRQGTQTPIPFGPFLAVGGWVAILWREPLLHIYF